MASWFAKTHKIDTGFAKIETVVKLDVEMIRQKFGWNPDVNPADAYDLDKFVAASAYCTMKPGPWTIIEED